MKYEDRLATASRGYTPVASQLSSNAGFTLIELLVAMTVLAVISLMLARIISQSNDAISEGTRQSTQNANARLAMDYIAREFAQAAGDARLKFKRTDSPSLSGAASSTYASSPNGFPGFPCHELRFVSFKNLLAPGDTSQPREAVMVAYYVEAVSNTYALMRAEVPIEPNTYSNVWTAFTPAVTQKAELIRYVTEFRVVCHETNQSQSVMSNSEQDHLPLYMDLYLSILAESEAKRARTFQDGSTDQINYIRRNAKRYYTRCWSLNRTAYIDGR